VEIAMMTDGPKTGIGELARGDGGKRERELAGGRLGGERRRESGTRTGRGFIAFGSEVSIFRELYGLRSAMFESPSSRISVCGNHTDLTKFSMIYALSFIVQDYRGDKSAE
jgi:hypothetical protein